MHWRLRTTALLLLALSTQLAGCAIGPAGPEIVDGKVRFVVVDTSGGG
ncbi:MAG: hypothetical protein AAF581_09140 [Planctomycetota bacterium]